MELGCVSLVDRNTVKKGKQDKCKINLINTSYENNT